MPSPNPLAGLHIAIRHHLSGVIIAWQRRVLLVAVVTFRQDVTCLLLSQDCIIRLC